MKPVRMGVLGVSSHFISRVLPPVKKSKLVELYAVASRSSEKAEEASKKYGIPRWFSSYEELLGDPSIEMVFIPLPNHLHLEWIKKSADAGKHIICEKPIAMNADEASKAVDYARKKDVKIMEAFMYRFHPQWIKALEIVKKGRIGKVQSIYVFFGYNNKNPDDIRNIKAYGGGALLDIGCYAVSSSRFLLESEPWRAAGLNAFDEDFGTDVLSSGILDFEDARTVFTVSTQTYNWQKVEVHGSEGVLIIEIPFNPLPGKPASIILARGGKPAEIIKTEASDHYLLQFDAFAKAVREDTEVPIPPEDAVNNMKVLDALFKSGGKGVWVKI